MEGAEAARQMKLRLEGPQAIGMVKVKVDHPEIQSSASRSFQSRSGDDDKSVLEIQLHYYFFPTASDSAPAIPESADIPLLVCKPKDVKRELVEFSLEGLYLY